MYYILNPEMEVESTLTLDSKGAKFYNDKRNVKIADDSGKIWQDTLELEVPYGQRETEMMTQGYHLLKERGDGFYYAFRIYNWEDTISGNTHVKKVEAYNLCIWDLYHKQMEPDTIENARSNVVFNRIFTQTGWHINNLEFTGSVDEVDIGTGETAQKTMDTMVQDFGVEVDAYVELKNGKIVNKYVDIVHELGENHGRRLEYSKDISGLTRTGDDTELFTKLYVYGGKPDNDDNDEQPDRKISIADAVKHDGTPFLIDEDANDKYNNSSDLYLEGSVSNDDITNPDALLDWGNKQLKDLNHPKYKYEVDVATLGYKPDLGETVKVIDFDMDPELALSARVLELTESEADPYSDEITLGEYVKIDVVTPDQIDKLAGQAEMAYRKAQEANRKSEKASYKAEISSSKGIIFKNGNIETELTCRVWKGEEEVTNSMPSSFFIWKKYDAEGNLDQTWTDNHAGNGNKVHVSADDLDARAIFNCDIDITRQ